MPCEQKKIDSNITGLRFAEESCIGELPTSVAATGLLTITGQPSDTQTVTIGTRTYTFNTVLGGANSILIDTTAALTRDNLMNAIIAGPGSGTKYGTGTAVHAQVTAAASGANMTVTAITAGDEGNLIVTTDTAANMSFGAATLTGGIDGVTWYGQEPNSYSDFGGQITTVARNPINPSRQRKKGVVTDLEASGGYSQDFTPYLFNRLMQGFLFADVRQKATTAPMNGPQVLVSDVDDGTDTYTIGSGGTSFTANSLVLAGGFGVAANNGLKNVVSSTGTTVVVSQALTDETPPSDANLHLVGYEFGAGEVSIAITGGLPVLTRVAGSKDFTTFGLIAGEWIFLGGDGAGKSFTNSKGFARLSANPTTTTMTFDKVDWVVETQAAGSLTVQIFFGDLLRNESDPDLIVRRSYQLERTLGTDDDGTQSEYIIGAVPSEFTFNFNSADKIMADMTFMATDHETFTGLEGVKAGARPSIPVETAFNTSSDFTRIKLATVSTTDANPSALFAFAMEMTMTINNNLSQNKALGVIGAFDVTAGTFDVGGSMNVYFADVAAVRAVRDNADVTVDIAMVKSNVGIVLDIPLLSLGDGRANVEQDQPIMLPLETNGAESSFGNTLTYQHFPYLPTIAG